jgi:hypothetical protein
MKRKQLVSAADVRRAADAKTLGVERAAEIHHTSAIAIRRALRDAAEATAARRLLALLDSPTTEGTNR